MPNRISQDDANHLAFLEHNEIITIPDDLLSKEEKSLVDAERANCKTNEGARQPLRTIDVFFLASMRLTGIKLVEHVSPLEISRIDQLADDMRDGKVKPEHRPERDHDPELDGASAEPNLIGPGAAIDLTDAELDNLMVSLRVHRKLPHGVLWAGQSRNYELVRCRASQSEAVYVKSKNPLQGNRAWEQVWTLCLPFGNR